MWSPRARRARGRNVHKLQDDYKLTLLSGWGKADYKPPRGVVDPKVDMKTPPPEQVDKMDAATFFARFADLLKDNPPNNVDYPTLHRLERVGIVAGEGFDLNAAPPAIKDAFERGTADAKKALVEEARKSSGSGRGWSYRLTGGAYGVDYMFRAAIAYFGLGYNLPQDAIYPSLTNDSEGRPLDGNNHYVIHFNKGKLPPVRAFWSVTGYGEDGYFIPNAIERQAIGDRDKLIFNADGSLDLYLQAESPGADKEGNWLPVAKGPFNLLMGYARTGAQGSWLHEGPYQARREEGHRVPEGKRRPLPEDDRVLRRSGTRRPDASGAHQRERLKRCRANRDQS